MNDYHQLQSASMVGANGMEFVLALYDGAIRFLLRASYAAQECDVLERRFAVKRALDIILYLQARLRPDIGGEPARALSDFYAAMFQAALEASHANSPEAFEQVIACLRSVREAWHTAASDPEVIRLLEQSKPSTKSAKPTILVIPSSRTAAVWSA